MSTPEHSVGIRAERPAERALFHALFDDAAVFPPGLAPLPRAVTDHVARQLTSHADLVGPLLLPASAIEDFLRLDRPRQVDVASIEVPGGSGQERALSDIQERPDDPNPVQAKFRTGSTPDSPVPSPTELATFIRGCVDHDLGFKLTGGLHRAISHTNAEGEDQFGFLNVIAATRWALAHGAEVPEMESLLSQRDPVPIMDIITRMSEADASVVRAFFTAYGCCGVMDPIGDLAALGLIRETTV